MNKETAQNDINELREQTIDETVLEILNEAEAALGVNDIKAAAIKVNYAEDMIDALQAGCENRYKHIDNWIESAL